MVASMAVAFSRTHGSPSDTIVEEIRHRCKLHLNATSGYSPSQSSLTRFIVPSPYSFRSWLPARVRRTTTVSRLKTLIRRRHTHPPDLVQAANFWSELTAHRSERVSCKCTMGGFSTTLLRMAVDVRADRVLADATAYINCQIDTVGDAVGPHGALGAIQQGSTGGAKRGALLHQPLA
jgi:hypothetical protein